MGFNSKKWIVYKTLTRGHWWEAKENMFRTMKLNVLKILSTWILKSLRVIKYDLLKEMTSNPEARIFKQNQKWQDSEEYYARRDGQ